MVIIKEIVQIFDDFKFDTEVLIKRKAPGSCSRRAKIGVHIETLLPEIPGKMMLHANRKGAEFLSYQTGEKIQLKQYQVICKSDHR